MYYFQTTGFPGIVPPQEGPAINPDICSWGRCLEVILQTEFAGPIDDEACGLYKLEITETATGKDIYFISLSQESKVRFMLKSTSVKVRLQLTSRCKNVVCKRYM